MTSPPNAYPLLDAIESPADLRQMPVAKLPEVAQELRQFLIHTVSTRGGHFAAGLGAVELAVALHYVYDTPHDRLVWTWAIRPIRTRCSRAAAISCTPSSSRVA